MARKRRTPAPGTVRLFHQFSRLPPNIRSRVWDLVEAEPRIVELRPYRGERRNIGLIKEIRCLTRAPAVLHVCREARRNVTRRGLYQRAFLLGKRYTWVNFDLDMISIKPIDFSWVQAEEAKIQRLRFEGENDEGFFHFRSHEVKNFTHLRELQIVCEDNVMHWVGIAEERQFPTENVFFMNKRIEGSKGLKGSKSSKDITGTTETRMYTREEMFEMFPSRPHPEYSDSDYRRLYDKRRKGSEDEIPEGYF